MRILILLAALATPALAAAQTPILPGQLISFEVDPGRRQETPTSPTTVVRPEANVAFEYRIDAGTVFIPAVKSAPCTPVSATAPILTCRLVPPTMAAGARSIQVRSVTSPLEPGVAISDWSAPLAVSVIIVTPTGQPSNVRVTPPAVP